MRVKPNKTKQHMINIAVLYGSSTGNTESVAKQIAEKIHADIFDVAGNPADKLIKYNNIILGTSTLGIGDLQDDWEDFLPVLAEADLTGKTIALFGLGDGEMYSDSFVDGMGIIYEAIKDKGCKIVGQVDTAGYVFDESGAVVNGKFAGLPLDMDNQDDLTDERIDKWVEQIKNEFS